ncbi:MAG: NAD(P)-dependent oxidoreductase [Myxococcota bacterium]|nr:NAD(P)-dependent oxidoreductase [Myxococcota bacterium]
MRVLIADKLPDTFRTLLQEAQAEVVVDASLKGDALSAALAEHDPDVLVVRSTKVQAEQLAAAKSLQLIVRGGAGVNTIDLEGASAKGVFVSNCPGMNAVAVAELTFGHLLNIDRGIADGVADLRAGKWRKGHYSKAGEGLKGKTLGIVGMGSIGKEVARRARAFEMEVVASSPSLTPEKAAALGVGYASDAIEVARQSDVLSVHCALTPSTRGLIGRAVLEALRPGAIFINTTRGPVVDEDALQWAISERGLRCGLDVFVGEPNAKEEDWTHPLVQSDQVWGTHHIGASTRQAQQAVADEALRVILQWAETGDAPNCVNLAAVTPATHMLAVRHADKVGVLAAILRVLAEQSINVEGMENIVFSGAQAALARIQISAPLDEAGLGSLQTLDGIFNAQQLSLS